MKFIFHAVFALFLSGCHKKIPAEPLTSAPPGSTFGNDGEYRIGPQDELKLRVVGDPTFDGVYDVADSGTVFLPVVGSIQVRGLTQNQAQAAVESRISSYVKKPSVTFTLASRRSYKAYFDGEFVRVGSVQFEGRPTLLAAITLAGGLTPFASGRIVLIRRDGQADSRRYAVRYQDLRDGSEAYDRFYVERGDVVVAE